MMGREITESRYLSDVVAALRQGLSDDLVAVALFGSRARGEAGEGSDWDIFVLAHHLPNGILERHQRLKRLLPDVWRGRVAVLAKTPQEFSSHLPPLWLDIALDGIVLYDPEGYVTDRLEQLRALIHRRGLIRERTGRNLVWRWECFPGFNWSLQWEQAS